MTDWLPRTRAAWSRARRGTLRICRSRGEASGIRYFFLDEVRRRRDLRAGTFPPARRASERPIAIACLRLFTLRPERPLRNLPCLRSCIARLTFSCAFLPYLA